MAPAPLPKLKRPATRDHLSSKPVPWQIVKVCMDYEKAAARRDAREALSQAEKLLARRGDEDEAAAAAVRAAREAADAAEAAYEESRREMLFVGIGRERYNALIKSASVPSSGADGKPAEGDEDVDPVVDGERLNVLLVAASCRVPEVTPEDIEGYFRDWNTGECDKLLQATLAVNTDTDLVELGKGSRGTNGFRRS